MIPPNLADNDVIGHYRDPFRANDARPTFLEWLIIVGSERERPGAKSFGVAGPGYSEQLASPATQSGEAR